ncbi:MAG: BACON domain-containing protein [Candidatus Cryptobacteroides sp.]
MRKSNIIIAAIVLGGVSMNSCKNDEYDFKVCEMKVDRESIVDVAAQNPGQEVVVLTTDAPYWILQTPDWITPDATTGYGEQSIVTFTIASNFRDENTDVAPRKGEIKFSGGMTSVVIPVSQLGYTAPVDPDASIGGIPDMDEFKDFIAAVNNGRAISRWFNADGEVELLTDLDLASFAEWIPVGLPEKVTLGNNSLSYTGSSFKGVFNGGGHTIRNFNINTTFGKDAAFGFFGVLDGAVVKDLNIEGTMTASATGAGAAGMLAGAVISSTIENVTVKADITFKGTITSDRFALGGVAGFSYATGDAQSLFKSCTMTGNVDAVSGDGNTANGATAVVYGGIVGFSTTPAEAATTIEKCENNGKMTVSLGRCSGIVATSHAGTLISGCVNNADQINTFGDGREGNIVSVIGQNSGIVDCVNNGNLTTTSEVTTAGAIAALLNASNVYITGGRNNGTIIGGNKTTIGLIAANFSKFTSVSGFTVSGKIGYYSADGNHEMQVLNESTYMNYVGKISDSNRAKLSDIKFVPAE